MDDVRQRVPVTAEVGFGTARLVPDPGRPDGWTLLVEGVPQSFVDLSDPTYLEFEYVRRLASVIDTIAPAGQPLRVLHLGGGGLTLPRYVAATRPGSVQLVIEHDAALLALVRRMLPVPDDAGIEVRVADARTAVGAGAAGVPADDDDRYDLVIGDVYHAARQPDGVTTVAFATRVAGLLRPAGCYAVNVADMPPLAFSRRQVATLRAAFTDVCLIAEPGLLRGRRYGNVVLVATGHPAGLPVTRLARAASRDAFPNRMMHGLSLDGFVAGALPFTGAVAPAPDPRPGPQPDSPR